MGLPRRPTPSCCKPRAASKAHGRRWPRPLRGPALHPPRLPTRAWRTSSSARPLTTPASCPLLRGSDPATRRQRRRDAETQRRSGAASPRRGGAAAQRRSGRSVLPARARWRLSSALLMCDALAAEAPASPGRGATFKCTPSRSPTLLLVGSIRGWQKELALIQWWLEQRGIDGFYGSSAASTACTKLPPAPRLERSPT